MRLQFSPSKYLLVLCSLMLSLNLVLYAEELSSGKVTDRDTKGLNIELISKVESIQPGKAFCVGLSLKHDKGFHTYWKNPGIVGMATAVKWELPAGFTASDLHWPYPELSQMAEYPCFGYERDVILYTVITPPQSFTEKNIKITANTNWMCCSDTCHPGYKKFSLTLPKGDGKIDPKVSEQFKQAESELPTMSTNITAELQSEPDAQTIIVKISSHQDLLLQTIYNSDGQTTPDLSNSLKKVSKDSWIFMAERSKYGMKSANTFPFILKTKKNHFKVIAVK